jgi:hypothetical protein
MASKNSRSSEAAPAAEAEQPVAEQAEQQPAPEGAADGGAPAVDHQGSEQPEAGSEAAADEPSIEEQLAELGLEADADGQVEIQLLVGVSGPETNLAPGDVHRCGAAEAVRFVRADFARPRG